MCVQCNVGWAGNGHTCGVDTDIDGYPDRTLPCLDNHKHCKQVRAATSSQGGHVTSCVAVRHAPSVVRTTAGTRPTLGRRTPTETALEISVTRTPTETASKTWRCVHVGVPARGPAVT